MCSEKTPLAPLYVREDDKGGRPVLAVAITPFGIKPEQVSPTGYGALRTLRHSFPKSDWISVFIAEDLEQLRYNTAIAALMTLLNDIRALGPPDRPTVETLLLMVAPFAPHIAEELWEALGYTTGIFAARWPSFDPTLTVEETIVVPVQVNGKVRSRIEVARDASDADVLAAALADKLVQAHLDGKVIRRRVVVPGRLVNLVV
jgi:leucyl-tRNA synthetase